jgi:hypothetical protein
MPGSIRALRRQADPVRGLGRIPLSKARTKGRPQFRQTGTNTLSEQERAIAEAIEDGFNRVRSHELLDALSTGDSAGFARLVLSRLAEAAPHIERTLLDSLRQSGEASALDIGRELSAQYRQVGKADTPLPSQVALQFRFNTADPRATAWAQAESARLITNMAASQQEVFRALVEQSFVEARTMGTTASSIFAQLQTVTPTPYARQFGEALGSNMNGLTRRYEQAVVNRVSQVADDLASRGITGTKALERMRKEGDKYATKLRRARSRTIARTERMMAHNQAQLLSYQQAIDSGLMSREHSRKVWSTGPFDVCPICVGMAGTEAKVADPFILPNGSQVQAPPAHPNCRCTLQTRTDTTLFEPPRALGSGQPGDPFRIGPRTFSSEGERLTGLTVPTAPTPTAVPVEPVAPPPQPTPPLPPQPAPPAPTPQPPTATRQTTNISGVRRNASQDDLDVLSQYGGAGTEKAVRPPPEVGEVFDREFAQRVRDLGPEPGWQREFLEERTEWVQRDIALRKDYREHPTVAAWREQYREAFIRNFGQDYVTPTRLEQILDGALDDAFRTKRIFLDESHGLTQDTIDNFVRRLNDPTSRSYQGIPMDDYEVRALIGSKASRFEQFLSDADLSIQIEPRNLSKVMKQGRFKSQFETGTSGGLKDLNIRRYEEYKMFGITPNADDAVRPIYGHIQRADRWNENVEHYGSARVLLKSEVKERASYTMTDSLGSPDMAYPVTRPNLNEVRIDRWGWPPEFGQDYVETQIHGGLSVDDIAEVIFDTTSRTYKPPTKTLLKELDEAGIPYRFVEAVRGEFVPAAGV